VDSRSTILGAADVDGRSVEMDLLPAEGHQLADPQRVPECHEDQQPIADRVAAVPGSGQQLIDLSLSQVLALPIVGVLGTTTTNCRLFR
jgi:hypothetical protein